MTQPLKQARLGRGLSALLGDYAGARNAIETPTPSLRRQARARRKKTCSPHPRSRSIASSRTRSSRAAPSSRPSSRSCAESIRAKGVLQPILVRPDPSNADMFEIIAGERRWRAARRAGLTTIPAVVREMDDREMLEIAIIENVQRADLNPVEEAEAYKALIDRFGRTQESVATQVGKSREHVSNTLRLLNLPDDVREHVREGRLTAGHARALLKTKDPSGVRRDRHREGPVGARHRSAGQGRQDRRRAAEVEVVADDDKDVDTKALELDLQRSLGLDVDIRHVNGKGGEVRIRYAQLEQLDEICRLLSRPRIVGSNEPRTDATRSIRTAMRWISWRRIASDGAPACLHAFSAS